MNGVDVFGCRQRPAEVSFQVFHRRFLQHRRSCLHRGSRVPEDRTQLRNHHWPWQHQFLSLLIAKWNGPAAKLVEAIDGINQMPIEGIAPHLSICDYVDSGPPLQLDRFIDCTIFERFEFRIVDLARLMLLARLF